MALNIYTAGSGEFLEIILNASAMITGSGFSEDLARIGLIIGMLMLGFQAIWNGQGISFHKAGLLFVLYLLFYGPTTTAVIEDTTTSQVRIVDNLPIGPTFVGSVISTVAYKITEVAEQGFSTPAMTEYGLFSSLNTIARVRDVLRNPMALDSFANYRKADGWDLPKSVTEYLSFCTLNPINLRNNTSIDELYRASGIEAIFNAPLLSQSAYFYDGGAGGRLESCTVIRPMLNAAIQDVMIDVMSEILDKGFAPEKAAGKVVTAADLENQIDQSLQSFAISAKNAQKHTQMSLIQSIFGDARVNALNHWQEQNAALALRESLNHQEVQWAGKGDTFKHYMRPMIAFFEGLLYAMTPFMAFAMVLGDKGMSILGKYLVLPLAIALWMPLLTIVNAFTLWYASAEMQAIFDGYDAVSDSFAMLQLMDMDHAISKALGVGGLLAASVPPLALFIVSGSAMVANSIMSQMTQGDKFKSEDVMPRSKEQATVLETTSSYTSDNIGVGATRTGLSKVTESFSGSQMSSALVQSTSTASETANSQYQESLKAAGMQMSQTGTGREALAQIGSTLAAGFVQGNNSSYTDSREALRSLGMSESSINEATANASLGLSTPFGGMKRADGSSASTMTGQDRSKAEKALAQLTESVQSTDTDTLTFATGDAFKSSALAQVTASNTDEIAQNRAKALQAQEVYQKAKSDQDSIGAMQSLTLRESSLQSLKKGGQGREEASFALANMAMSTESGRELYNKAFNNEDIRELSTDLAERRSMAATRALNQDGRLGELLSSQYSPLDFEWSPIDSNANSHLVDKAARANQGTEGLQDRFEAKRSSNAERFTDTDTMNRDGYHETKSSGAEAVANKVDSNNTKVTNSNSDNLVDIERANSSAFYDAIVARGEGAMQGSNVSRIVAEGANAAFTGIDTIANAFRGGNSERLQGYYDIGIANGLDEVEAQYFAAKATGEFGQSEGDAYRELVSHYRGLGVHDNAYISGAIGMIDDAAIAPEKGSYSSLSTLSASKASITKAQAPTSNPREDVPFLPPKPSINN